MHSILEPAAFLTVCLGLIVAVVWMLGYGLIPFIGRNRLVTAAISIIGVIVAAALIEVDETLSLVLAGPAILEWSEVLPDP